MKAIWNYLVTWFQSHGGVTHVIAAAYVAAVAAYASVPAFTQLVNTVYGVMPSWAHQLLAAAAGLIAWYTNTSKTRKVQDEPHAS